jgi:hypothetical protein
MAPDPLPTLPAREGGPGLTCPPRNFWFTADLLSKSGGANGHRPKGLISRTACLARTELAELAFTHSRPACADEDGNAYSWQRDPTREQTDRLRPARSIRWASSASSTPSRTSAKPTDPL